MDKIVFSSFWFGLFISLWMLATSTPTAAESHVPKPSVVNQSATVYENETITEDANWNGYVVVKGALIVAPQATLRIEPGTEILFTPSKGSRQLPRLVVLGRIQGVGTLDKPILFTSSSSVPSLPSPFWRVL